MIKGKPVVRPFAISLSGLSAVGGSVVSSQKKLGSLEKSKKL